MPLTANKLNKKILSPVVILLSILSAVFFLVLFSSVRCEPDDMVAGLNFRHHSFLEIYRNNYWYDTFRPMYPLLMYFVVGITSNINYYPIAVSILYTCIMGVFVFSVYKLLQRLFTFDSKLTPFNKMLLACFSLLFLMSLYFTTTNRIEIFAWLSGSVSHLVPVIFIFISAYVLIKEHKKRDYLYLIVCVFFIGGGAEHIAPALIATVGICMFLFFYKRKDKKKVFQENKPLLFKIVFFSTLLSLFFLFTVITPGAWHRYYNTQQYVKIHSPERNLEILHIIKSLLRPYKLTGVAFLFFTWMFFIKMFRVKLRMTIHWKYHIATLIVVTITTSIFCAFCYNTLNVDRMWFVFDLIVFIIVSALIIEIVSSRKANVLLSYSGIIYVLGMVILFDIRHIPTLLTYSSTYDNFILSLQQKNTRELVQTKELPSPDLIMQTPLNTDPEDGFNVMFCNFYNIQAKVSSGDALHK
jgi:hypothetical protein